MSTIEITEKPEVYPSLIPTYLFAAGSAAIVIIALGWPGTFGQIVRAYPFSSGFVKFFLLGTFGEALKRKFKTGTWALDRPFQRATIWGLFGMWFVLAFPAFSKAVEGLCAEGLWPSAIPAIGSFFGEKVWMAFSKSVWLNVIGMYGWGMMVTHNYLDFVLHNNWKVWSLKAYARQADREFLLAFIPKTLLFWVVAQTINFCMPAEWRVFIAALFAIVLGFLLGVGGLKKTPQQEQINQA